MKKNRVFVFVLGLLCFCSCSEEKNISQLLDIFPSQRTLTPEVRAIDGAVGSHMVMERAGDYLIGSSYSPYREMLYSVVDPLESKSVNMIVSRGRGRNEFLSSYSVQGRKGEFSYFENSKSELRSIKVEELLKPNPEIEVSRVKLPYDGDFLYNIDKTAVFPSGNILRSGYDTKKETILQILNTEGEPIRSFGTIDFGFNKHHQTRKRLSGCMHISEDGTRLVWASNGGAVFRFYDCTDPDAEPKLIKEYNYEMPIHNVEEMYGGISVSLAKGISKGVIKITSSKDKFFLQQIYFDIVAVDNTLEMQNEGSNILVFDLNGEPIEVLKIDGLTSSVEYIEKTNSLYTVGSEEEYDTLLQYKL